MRELIFIFTTILHQDRDTTHYRLISRMKLMKMMIDSGPKNGEVRKDKDGYFAFTPELQGCYSQGDTYEEAKENIRDAIALHIEDRLESG